MVLVSEAYTSVPEIYSTPLQEESLSGPARIRYGVSAKWRQMKSSRWRIASKLMNV